MMTRYIPLLFLLLFFPGAAYPFCFDQAGAAYGISPALLRGIAGVESGMNPAAQNRNSNGSIDFGLMQINSSWLKQLGLSSEELLRNPCQNVKTGARILKDCLERYGDSWEAIGCYNATGRDKRANYSWKVYRELQKAAKGGAGNSGTHGTRFTAGAGRSPSGKDTAEADGKQSEAAGGKAAIPMVSSIEISVVE
jgi:hypothetical protein